MIFTTLFGIFGCGKSRQKAVTSVESMTLTVRGMRGGYVYKLESEDDVVKLQYYREVYSGEDTLLVLEAVTPCDIQNIIDLMNVCGVISWDGFHGKHPKNVQDGIMFCFTATVNEEQAIRAEGSANFPNGYHEFVRTLNELLAQSEITEK